MKIKNIKITINDRKQALNEFAHTLARAREGEIIYKHKEISFQDVYTLRKFLTEKRIELLHIIKHYNPESMYELAKIVNRDLKSITTDISILKDLNLVSLEKIKEKRIKVKPKVEFNKINVEITI